MAHNRVHREAVRDADGCTILGCGRKVAALGMCWGHYRRDLRGQPVHVYLSARRSRSVVVEFGPATPGFKVLREYAIRHALQTLWTPEPNTGCWLWLGEFYPSGYGRIGTTRDPWGGLAHRAVLHFSGTTLERRNMKRHVRHLCDNRACVNPAHLSYGTAAENCCDRERHGRSGSATHTPDQVRAIRELLASGMRPMDIASLVGTDAGFVSRIKSGVAFRWLESEPITSAAA